MKQTLQLKLGQQLTMTPQLQQAIKLLQLSSIELQHEIQDALESNPLLEADEADHEKNEEIETKAEDIPSELEVDTGWEDIYPTAGIGPTSKSIGEGSDDFLLNSYFEEENLHTHLTAQLELCSVSRSERLIAETLIDAINDDGYLTTPLADIEQTTDQADKVNAAQIEKMLSVIQSFDPPGIGARNLKECLAIQLSQLPPKTPFFRPALQLVENGLELLAKAQLPALKKSMQLTEEELIGGSKLIQSLNPYPGRTFSSQRTEYIVPDVIVKKVKHRWVATLNNQATPKLKINSHYASLIKRSDDSSTNHYLKQHMQEAKWLMKSIESRNETLLKVANYLVDYQHNFFEYGEEAMKPLVLQDVASAIEMHESTISRVTTRKYMLTPKGIFELKYFFSSHVATQTGGECSSTAIRALIKKLIASEPSDKPLSDNKIAQLLTEQGIQVARRTVAKYREAMSIPPSNERKQVNWLNQQEK